VPEGGEGADLAAENAALRAELDTCRQLVAQVMDAEDQGRRRIAQLIHDDSLQTLLAANQDLIEAAPGRAQVQRAHEVVEAAIGRLREAMMALHPVTLEQGGFEQALGAVARQAGRQGGFEVSIDLAPEAMGREDELLLAIARELLTNAARHSGADAVSVALRDAGGALELEVIDDGSGIAPGRRDEALAEGHIGLASVNERVRAADGEFELESSPAGTRALARIPV
jgi:two-component system, NarL family, sensor kinase